MLISVNAHGSRTVPVVGHSDCAGNRVPDQTHLQQISRSAELLMTWGLDVRVLGLWVNRRWTVEVICDSEGSVV